MFHNLIDLSAPAEIIYLLSGENPTENTSFVWPLNYLTVFPSLKSQSLRVLSHEADKTKLFSLDRARSDTKWLCPKSYFMARPYSPSGEVSSNNFQIIKDLSLDPDTKIVESSFSFYECPETIEVTQLVWPSRVPKNTNSYVVSYCWAY